MSGGRKPPVAAGRDQRARAEARRADAAEVIGGAGHARALPQPRTQGMRNLGLVRP
jgi:hypothetical protein